MTTTKESPPSPVVAASAAPRRKLASGVLDRTTPRTPSQIVQRVMLAVLVFSVLTLCIVNATFRQPDNLLNIVQQASMVGVIRAVCS